MRDNFLTPPQSIGEWLADGVRLIGVVSLVAAVVWFRPTDIGVLALVLPGLLWLRALGLAPWFDIVSGVVLLVAAWSNVLELYARIGWWDLAVHFACTGVLAAMTYLSLCRAGVVVPPAEPRTARLSAVLITASLGLALSAVWEMVEWVGHTFISAEIYVEYGDTIGDMAVGGVGAVAAGILIAYATLETRDVTQTQNRMTARASAGAHGVRPTR